MAIVSFRSKALRLFFTKGDSTKLSPHHVSRIKAILSVLNVALSIDEIRAFDRYFHGLQPPGSNTFSMRVSGNYRITFRYEDGQVYDVDYLDYH